MIFHSARHGLKVDVDNYAQTEFLPVRHRARGISFRARGSRWERSFPAIKPQAVAKIDKMNKRNSNQTQPMEKTPGFFFRVRDPFNQPLGMKFTPPMGGETTFRLLYCHRRRGMDPYKKIQSKSTPNKNPIGQSVPAHLSPPFSKAPGKSLADSQERGFSISFRNHCATLEGGKSKINTGMTRMETALAPLKSVPLLLFSRTFYLAAMIKEDFSVAGNSKSRVKTKNLILIKIKSNSSTEGC